MCDLAAIYLVTSQTNQHLHAIYNCYKKQTKTILGKQIQSSPSANLPGHEDVDKAFISMKLG